MASIVLAALALIAFDWITAHTPISFDARALMDFDRRARSGGGYLDGHPAAEQEPGWHNASHG